MNLLIEVTGEKYKEKAAKVEAARTRWVPAINNDGRFGRWAFLEITDPDVAGNLIRAALLDIRGVIRMTTHGYAAADHVTYVRMMATPTRSPGRARSGGGC